METQQVDVDNTKEILFNEDNRNSKYIFKAFFSQIIMQRNMRLNVKRHFTD